MRLYKYKKFKKVFNFLFLLFFISYFYTIFCTSLDCEPMVTLNSCKHVLFFFFLPAGKLFDNI